MELGFKLGLHCWQMLELFPPGLLQKMVFSSGIQIIRLSSLPLLEKTLLVLKCKLNRFNWETLRLMIAVDIFHQLQNLWWQNRYKSRYKRILRNIHFPIGLSFNLQSSLLAVNAKSLLVEFSFNELVVQSSGVDPRRRTAAASWVKSGKAQCSSNIPLDR